MTTLDEAIAIGRGIERSFNCPDPDHEDRNASASVNVAKGVWVCYGCGKTGKTGKTPMSVAMKAVIESMIGDQPTPVFSEQWLAAFDGHHVSPYWSQRVGEETAALFRCGTHPFTSFPTYPIRDQHGRVLGVVQRQPEPLEPKYRYPTGVAVSRLLFGFEYVGMRSHVLLCEGAADVMAVYATGVTQVTAVGVYGAGIHAPQADLLASRRPSSVLIGFDNDAAGRAATHRTHAVLHQRGINNSWFRIPSGAKDLADIPRNELRDLLTDAVAAA